MTPPSPMRPLFLGGFTIALLLGGLVGWGMFTELSGAVVASGRIDLERHQHVVQHIDGGVISEILVEEGDFVEQGQTLIRLDPEDRLNRLAIIENELFEISARIARLKAERNDAESVSFPPELVEASGTDATVEQILAGERGLFRARQVSMQREIEELGTRGQQIGRQIEGIQAQLQATDAQLALLAEDIESQRGLLDRGLIQASGLRELERQHSQLLGSMGELTAAKSEAAERLAQNRIARLRIAAQRREEAIRELRELEPREFELRERRIALSREVSMLEIRAPVAGVIHALVVSNEQSVIRAAEPILQIVPRDRPRVATVQIEPMHVEQIFLGQSATVQLEAFDARAASEIRGRVSRISADTFEEERTGREFYQIEILMPSDELPTLPEAAQLKPGMPVTAFIRTTTRTPMEYLLSPIGRYFSRALRES